MYRRQRLGTDLEQEQQAFFNSQDAPAATLGKLSDLKKEKLAGVNAARTTESGTKVAPDLVEKDIVRLDPSPMMQLLQQQQQKARPVVAASETATGGRVGPAGGQPKKKLSLFAQQRLKEGKKDQDQAQNQNRPTAPMPEKVSMPVFNEIKEREPNPTDSVQAPSSRTTSFPEATHRDGAPQFGSSAQSIASPTPYFDAIQQKIATSLTADAAQAVDPHSASLQRMKREIEEENAKSLQKMTNYEISQAQQELLGQLDPKILSILQSRIQKKTGAAPNPTQNGTSQPAIGSLVAPRSADLEGGERPAAAVGRSAPPKIVSKKSLQEEASQDSKRRMAIAELPTEEELLREEQRFQKSQIAPATPVSAAGAQLEGLKTEWMKPVSDVEAKKTLEQKRSILEAEAYRFDFEGHLLVYPAGGANGGMTISDDKLTTELTTRGKKSSNKKKSSASIDSSVLYHHGEEASLPGYNLPELQRLARSQLPGQRQGALRALECIIHNAKNCRFSIPRYESEPTIVSSLLLNYLDKECDIGLMLRTAIDDTNITTAVAALKALHAFVCNDFDEQVFALVEPTWRGHESMFTTSKRVSNMAKRPGEDDEAADTDTEKIQQDIIMGLIETGFLGRLRFMLYGAPIPDDARGLILEIFTAVARHSDAAATHFVKCPHLLDAISDRYLTKPVCAQTALGIRALRAAAQSSRRVASVIIFCGLVSHTGLFMLPEIEKWTITTPDAPHPEMKVEAVTACAESLKLLNVLIRYGFQEISPFVHSLLPTFIRLLATDSEENRHPMRELLRGHIMQIFEGIVQISLDPASGEHEAMALRWNHVSPILHIALTLLASSTMHYGQTVLTSTAVHQHYEGEDEEQESPPFMLLAWIVHFIASYLETLPHRATPKSTEDEMPRFDQIASKYLIPFINSPIVHEALVQLSSDRQAWLNNEVVLGCLASPCFVLDNSTTLCWSELIKLNPPASTDAETEEELLPAAELKSRDFLQRTNLLLALCRAIDALTLPKSKAHSETLVNFLKSAEGQLGFLGPLSRVVTLYNDKKVGLTLSTKHGANFVGRTLQHLVARLLQYLPAATSQIERLDATLQLISRILPGDEELFDALIEGILKPAQVGPDTKNILELSRDSKILEFFKDIASTRAVDDDDPYEHDSDDEEMATPELKAMPRVSDNDLLRPGFALPVDRSLLPLGKNWLYSPIRRFREFAVATGLADQQGAGVQFLRDAVSLATKLESIDKLNYLSTIAIDVKLYSIMQIFLLDMELYTDATVSAELDQWLRAFVGAGSHKLILDRKLPLDVALIEKVVQSWSLQSFAHPTPGKFVALFAFLGALAPLPASKDAEDFETSLKHVFSSIDTMWHQLPVLPFPSWSERVRCAFHPSVQRPSLLVEFLTRALRLPRAAFILQGKSQLGAEKFYLAFLIHTLSAIVLRQNSGVAAFMRQQFLNDILAINLDGDVLDAVLRWDHERVFEYASTTAKDENEIKFILLESRNSELNERKKLLAEFSGLSPVVAKILSM